MPSLPLPLSNDDKLDALRHLDEFRFWRSLDDERRCSRCRETINGRQVLVFETLGTRGKLRLQCPTPGCPSGPSEWLYANPVLFAGAGSPKGSPVAQRRNGDVSPERYRQMQYAGITKAPARRQSSLRAALARLPVLRPLAMGLHAIFPVA